MACLITNDAAVVDICCLVDRKLDTFSYGADSVAAGLGSALTLLRSRIVPKKVARTWAERARGGDFITLLGTGGPLPPSPAGPFAARLIFHPPW